jgi:hypothetical protein
MRSSIVVIIVVVLLTNAITGTISYLFMSQRSAVAAAADAEKHAEAVRQALETANKAEIQRRNQVEVIRAFKAFQKIWLPAPVPKALPDAVRFLRKHAEDMDLIDTSGCPPDAQNAFKNAAQAVVDFANYWERTELRHDDSAAKAFLPLVGPVVMGLLTENVAAIPIIAEKAIESAGNAKQNKAAMAMQNQEADDEAGRQFKNALIHLGKVIRRYLPPQEKVFSPK